jgi:hypothetical protein
MGIPLEIIVKAYSKKLGTNSFPELKDYARDFIDYLKSNYFKEIDPDEPVEIVKGRMYQMLEGLVDTVKDDVIHQIDNGQIPEPTDENAFNTLINKHFKELLESLHEKIDKAEVLPDFKDYEIANFKEDYKSEIDKILKGFYSTHGIKRTAKTTTTLYHLAYKELTTEIHPYENYSGIVIAGYGEDQIFPALTEIYLAEVISNRLRYMITNDREITHNNNAIVIPFAQRDMVDTFFQGIDPSLLEKYQDQIIESFEELVSSINKEFKLDKEASIRKHFQKQYGKLGDKFRDIRDQIHVQPIVNSVSYLPKEDLIELAESLVNITSLKRKTSNDIHSVGGPVDIALISKFDGFQWIKQKDN